jgi:hypothetical protein
MKYIFFILSFCYNLSVGQSLPYRVFSISGEAYLIDSKTKKQCYFNDRLNSGAKIQIISGELSLLSSDLFRIRLDKPGLYSYTEIDAIYLENRGKEKSYRSKFFSHVVSLIKNDKKYSEGIGGVVRGSLHLVQPIDSCIVFGDGIPISISDSAYFTVKIRDSLGVVIWHKDFEPGINYFLDFNILGDNWLNGWYALQVEFPEVSVEETRVFFVPDNLSRIELIEEFDWILDGFFNELNIENRKDIGLNLLEQEGIYLIYVESEHAKK